MTAIVTGAAQGLGKSFVERLVKEGCNVSMTDKRAEVDRVGDTLGALAFQGEVGDSEHVKHVADTTFATFGTIDILINNAGEVLPTGPLDNWEDALHTYERIFSSNTRGAYLFGRAVAPIMVKQNSGNILNVSTDHVKPAPHALRHHGHGNMDLYNASKWALNGLTFDWASSLRKYNIRVNNLCIGATDTEMIREWSGPDADPEWVKSWMKPEDVAGVVVDLFLEGPRGRTGDNIGLYAGYDCILPPPESE
ncbi:MAG TPA: SDR family oxidoreductase [Candidatus Thalassarchaeaceae archaeon]|jgi:NAD(P)-dependent dehydrogenase (short-subunit alcohol dehydrogenase family)|nr:SDR family oxidoreductase [Candidatus Thalassarchaeaceae archaeon]